MEKEELIQKVADEATINDLVEVVQRDVLAVHDALRGGDKKETNDIMAAAESYEINAAKEAVANSLVGKEMPADEQK